ncbi:hypothetical protein [Macrococcus sp. DPC7161]|uniref:hypothetical protein n=1 Tax=Macrococcus sp. DPC7161 TaxID=2507060 RepID=UPI00100C0F49|nr:hypothetical protein [Macrococcus sp. DPC7161]RXK19081.1 hypothetical protein ER639_01845 [Macrococcus sp. DPC7161]
MNKVTKLDSNKPYSPQYIIDQIQKEIDGGKVEDLIVISRKGDDIRYFTSPISDVETIGTIEIVKMNIL